MNFKQSIRSAQINFVLAFFVINNCLLEANMQKLFESDVKGRQALEIFLESFDLSLDQDIEKTYVKKSSDGKIIATGSIAKNVLKSIAVDKHYQGSSLINEMVSYLMEECYQMGETHLFIYTKPESYKAFEFLGFKKITETNRVVLMENKINGFQDFLKNIKDKELTSPSAGIVLNANPFTKGHYYLVKRASEENPWVHVFVVWENQSTFSNVERYNLVSKGLKDLKNVSIHKGLNYIISAATFPSYFISGKDEVIKEQTKLDLKLFGDKIAPSLGINKRYVGKEPFNNTTAKYNETMKKVLPDYGIEVIEIERKKIEDQIISASTVRRLIYEGDLEKLKCLVPKSTFEYLKSPASQGVINKIKKDYNEKKLV